MNIVGTLKNARRVSVGEDRRAPCLRGQVYGDTKGRFCDGEWITTSTIMEEQGNLFRTRFSAYRVESWEGEAANENGPADKTLTHAEIVRGLNLWMDRYIANPKAFEAEFEVVTRHLAERDDGVESTYGEVGLDFIVRLLGEAA